MVAASRWFLVEKSHGRPAQKKRHSYGRQNFIEQPVYVSSVRNQNLSDEVKQQPILQVNRHGPLRHNTSKSKPIGMNMALKAKQHFQPPQKQGGNLSQARKHKTTAPPKQNKAADSPKNDISNGHSQNTSSPIASRTSSGSSSHTNSPISSSKERKKNGSRKEESASKRKGIYDKVKWAYIILLIDKFSFAYEKCQIFMI